MERLRPRYPGETAFNRWDYWQKLEYCAKHKIKDAPPKLSPEEQKEATRRASMLAIKKGELVRPDACQGCGEPERRYRPNPKMPERSSIECHHRNYADPMDVEWLCKRCHSKRHRELRRSA